MSIDMLPKTDQDLTYAGIDEVATSPTLAPHKKPWELSEAEQIALLESAPYPSYEIQIDDKSFTVRGSYNEDGVFVQQLVVPYEDEVLSTQDRLSRSRARNTNEQNPAEAYFDDTFIERLNELFSRSGVTTLRLESNIFVNQFYGAWLDKMAHELAVQNERFRRNPGTPGLSREVILVFKDDSFTIPWRKLSEVVDTHNEPASTNA